MSVRLVAPLSGLVVSTPFLAGAFSSDSKLSESFNIPSSWSVKSVEPVEVSYTCVNTRGGHSQPFGTFNIKVEKDVLDKEKDKLAENQSIRAQAKFEFQVKEGWDDLNWLRGRGTVYMSVDRKYDGGLRITLKESDARHGNLANVDLDCRIDGNSAREIHGPQSVNDVFKDQITFDTSRKSLNLQSGKGTLLVSKSWCDDGRSGTKTCALKVADINGWRWNVQSFQRLSFTPSK